MTAEKHEGADLDARRVLSGGLIVFILVVFALLAAWLYTGLLGGEEPYAVRVRAQPTAPPPPQPRPREDLQHYRAAQQARLEGYRWIDRKSGIIQIPIEQAMRALVAERAARPEAAQSSERGADATRVPQ